MNLIFDLDGTLVDSYNDVAACLKKAITGRGLSAAGVNRNIIGPPLPQLISKLFPSLTAAETLALSREFRALYDSCDMSGTSLFPGVAETLHLLHTRGCRMFIGTYKPLVPTRRILKHCAIDHYFEQVATVDLIAERLLNKAEMLATLIEQNALIVSDTIMIGDAASDIEAACVNGIKSVAMAYGYGSSCELKIAKADYYLRAFNDLSLIIPEV